MIKVEIVKDASYKKLMSSLENFPKFVDLSAQRALNSLYLEMSDVYEECIDEFVYEKYDPIEYQRTLHLKGRYGAMMSERNSNNNEHTFEFYIDGSSKDPNDGATWLEKAENVESGNMDMYGGSFARPFINQTEDALADYMDGVSNAFELDIDSYFMKL